MSESIITYICEALTLWPAGLPSIWETTAVEFFSLTAWTFWKKNKTQNQTNQKKLTWYLLAFRPSLSLKNFLNTQKIHSLVKECFLSLMGENCQC